MRRDKLAGLAFLELILAVGWYGRNKWSKERIRPRSLNSSVHRSLHPRHRARQFFPQRRDRNPLEPSIFVQTIEPPIIIVFVESLRLPRCAKDVVSHLGRRLPEIIAHAVTRRPARQLFVRLITHRQRRDHDRSICKVAERAERPG